MTRVLSVVALLALGGCVSPAVLAVLTASGTLALDTSGVVDNAIMAIATARGMKVVQCKSTPATLAVCAPGATTP